MLTVHQVRDRIASQITSALGASGWLESRYPPEMFGWDSREQRHKGFSVGVPATTFPEAERQNARSSTRRGVVTTAVVVRWGHQLRVDGVAVDYGAALDAEAALIEAVLDANAAQDLGLRITAARRTIQVADGDAVEHLLYGTLELQCLHVMALE